MGIKGFMDKDKDAPLWKALPEIARLRKGMKTDDPKRPIVDLDYFRVDFNEPFAHLEPIFTELYGKEPTVFDDVEMFGNSVDDVFSMDMEQYNTSGTLIRRCDRESQSRWYDEKSGYHMTARKACDSTWGKDANNQRTHKGCDCDERGKLNIVLGKFAEATGVYGYFLVQTGSINDLVTIVSALRFWEQRCKDYRIPMSLLTFTLGRANEQITAPMIDKQTKQRTGKRINVTKSLFYLYTDREQVVQARELAYQSSAALPAPAMMLADGTANETMMIEVPAKRMSNGELVPVWRGNMRDALGAGGGGRSVLREPLPFTPSTQVEMQKIESPADDVVEGEATDVTETPPPAPETPLVITRQFVGTHIKYISQGTNSYMAFIDPNDQPGWLYLKDFEAKFDALGPEFQAFQLNLKPSTSEAAEALLLPESLTVTVESRTKQGKAFWEVTDLKRVEQAQEGGQVAS